MGVIHWDGSCECVEESFANVQRELARVGTSAAIGTVTLETMSVLVRSGAFRSGGVLDHGGGCAVLRTPLGVLVVVVDGGAEALTLTVRDRHGEVVAHARLAA